MEIAGPSKADDVNIATLATHNNFCVSSNRMIEIIDIKIAVPSSSAYFPCQQRIQQTKHQVSLMSCGWLM